ncbi:MAG TPA: isocitrate/isopropylmalate family dehydrogenase, partial [Clostridia bacterium]|nr:isocitrate/isopropylmalate family dehydrogenase [Clostridia bacterium]
MFKIAVLPGDGIGVEVTEQAVRVLKKMDERHGFGFVFEEGLIGGAAYDKTGSPLPEETR